MYTKKKIQWYSDVEEKFMFQILKNLKKEIVMLII